MKFSQHIVVIAITDTDSSYLAVTGCSLNYVSDEEAILKFHAGGDSFTHQRA